MNVVWKVEPDQIDETVLEVGTGFTMSLTGPDVDLVIRLVNIGIDGRLEACYCPSRGDRYEVTVNIARRLNCAISPESLVCLLHRLEDDGSDAADDLRYDILTSLGIEVT